VAPLTKFAPVTVRGTGLLPPATTLEGDRTVSTGAAEPLLVKVAVTIVGLLFTVTVQGVLVVGVQALLQLVKVEPAVG